ncbi:hypothetical protein P7K49_024777 [Saguinus oedipus]|uniref:Uncharacterized protein n=1 Tax=Saguinus oedipus TaxID=9490 RepID=A0ABQ9UQH4_SAGOE|nr:hypothetical protein P7K49_024777 [Saguinus oedipus]
MIPGNGSRVHRLFQGAAAAAAHHESPETQNESTTGAASASPRQLNQRPAATPTRPDSHSWGETLPQIRNEPTPPNGLLDEDRCPEGGGEAA